jgi:RNA polymerase sigma-70 factor (ECF subfamily)
MELARAGSEEAARELIDVYGPHLRRAVRRQMDPRLRRQFDSDDFMQEVWQRFFAHLDKLSEVDHPQALVAFLSKLARNQVADACRKFLHCPRHHPDREETLSDATGQEPKNLPAKQASASQIFEAKELEEGLRQSGSTKPGFTKPQFTRVRHTP